jgi:septal ring factor EnvC (AmiA/AmiB activator)
MRWKSAVALVAVALLAVGSARAADIGTLRDKVGGAREEAAALGAEIRDTQERLAATEAEAAAAAARERRLTDLLAHGRARAARLAAEAERKRLRRARRALARRLVAIYMSGTPSTASIVLGSGDINELEVRSEYLQRIEDSDSRLAARVEDVRNEVRRELKLVAEL